MAPINAHRVQLRAREIGHVDARVPPPSSILATHIAPINGHGLPHIDGDSLAQLIEECLACDEDGLPTLGNDFAVNQKLISVIIKAGIDHAFTNHDEPFEKQGRNIDRVTRCLDVIDLAIHKSPQVLYAQSDQDDLGAGDQNVSLFAWLVPKLLWLASDAREDDRVVSRKSWSVLHNLVATAARCSSNSKHCGTVSNFIASCTSGTASHLSSHHALTAAA